MKFPTYPHTIHRQIAHHIDYVRYQAFALALATLDREGIPGSIAECGVFRGETSRLLHELSPERTLYLFDTFSGFPAQDLAHADERFSDTSIARVASRIGDTQNIVFREGYFPDTCKGLEDARFAFVLLDFDLFKPTLAGLQFFYPRTARGGYIFAHDYNNPESERAVSRAVQRFMADKPERIIEIPDIWGSIVFRKA